jgi:hypothetical protein
MHEGIREFGAARGCRTAGKFETLGDRFPDVQNLQTGEH